MEHKEQVLTEAQAAKVIEAKPMTLNKWRCRGRGPVYYKLSGKIRYRMSDLQAFIDAARVIPSEHKAKRRRRVKR